MRVALFILLALPIVATAKARNPRVSPIYKDKTASVQARTDDLIRRLTLKEKILLLQGNPAGMENYGISRLGIPAIKMADGPLGVRHEKSTAFPSAINMGATFNPDLMRQEGLVMADETLAQGRDMLLGPCVNISRAPQGGRNFESFGEDPYLTSRFAEQWVSSVQSKGVIASTKHFAANDQEFERLTIDVNVSERALNEIHWPAFRAAIRAGTLSIMSAYNRLNGHYASENKMLLRDTLKDKWKFPGFVISDWEASHSTIQSANAGLDMEMPTGAFWGDGKLYAAVKDRSVSATEIDDKVRRILRAQFLSGSFDRKAADRPSSRVVNRPAHGELAREVASQSLVLLKNENQILPLRAPLKQIAVIGPNAVNARNQGGGSSHVVPLHDISPYQGLLERGGTQFSFSPAEGVLTPTIFETLSALTVHPAAGSREIGLKAEYFDNPNLAGRPIATRVEKDFDFVWHTEKPPFGKQIENFSVRLSGVYEATATGPFTFSSVSDDGIRVYFDNKLVVDSWAYSGFGKQATLEVVKGQTYDFRVEYYQGLGGSWLRFGINPLKDPKTEFENAVKLAATSDAAVVVVGWNDMLEGEALDRASLNLPAGQEELVEAISAVNPHTIVVINGGGSVLMPWLSKVEAVVQAFYPGQEGGYALADNLLGRANFSGKLPVSFYAKHEDASSFENFPGANGRVDYKEGIFVGYRHLDRNKIAPLFPFGFGLSYTQFEFSNMQVSEQRNGQKTVTVEVQNIGSVAGAEVAQLYIHEINPIIDRAEQELKGFKKVWLKPGEKKTVTLSLAPSDFAYYSEAAHDWTVHPGAYEIRIGNSSRNLPLKQEINIR